MEQVHGVDVRWMSQGHFKEKFHKPFPATNNTCGLSSPAPELIIEPPSVANPQTTTTGNKDQSDSCEEAVSINGSNPPSRQLRPDSAEKAPAQSIGAPPPHHRRNSWFSNISAKFSGTSSQTTNAPVRQQQQTGQQPALSETQSLPQPTNHQSSLSIQSEPVVPRIPTNRNAVLQHASVPEGDGPYTPAPPKSGQAGFLGVLRRLSSSANISNTQNGKWSHGLVERKILNVDRNRERCPIAELKDNKLRRVSFCVDVEIAPMPKYTDSSIITKPIDKNQKKMTERGEGEALKNPKAAEAQNEAEKVNPETLHEPKESKESTSPKDEMTEAASNKDIAKPEADGSVNAAKETTRKKEKKKKSEEERKARKEKRRKLAEANGSIPVEIQYDDSESSDSPDGSGSPKSASFPTTNPVRIYRRCCQLRETPILKKITEQLNNSANTSPTTGFVTKLDLTGYSMQLADLVTLGDYLAVVPVREIILDGIGLTDEGLRVILAGLLAAKQPEFGRRRHKSGVEPQSGVVERLSLKENDFGIDGWKYISLFIYRSRSLKQLDISKVPFPRQPAKMKNHVLGNGLQMPLAIAEIFAKSLAERPAGSMLEMVNMGETEPSMEQFGTIIDGCIQCGVTRLGVANNHLDKQGLQHVARYLQAGKCEGLDLGGNDLRDDMDIIASSMKANDPLWAISLAGCNLHPDSLVHIFPILTLLHNLRFLDFSHNRDLFDSKPSAVGVLRRCLPKMEMLKRLHLQDVNMTAEHAIAIVEILPEVHQLCHINLLGNTEITKLADARTEEAMEEACALYASLMAAARISKSIMCVDIEVPSSEASEIVKAMAKQVVAYCLRNMEQLQTAEVNSAVASAVAEAQAEWSDGRKSASSPHMIAHLVVHDVFEEEDATIDDDEDGDDATADENYVIGGTGVVKALTFCLANRGDDSRVQGGESSQNGIINGETSDVANSQGLRLATRRKAKDMSKHLLAGARKIRLRLQPALVKAKANPSDEINLRKLMFLDETLQGVIKRFEDEFPETRESAVGHAAVVEAPPAQTRGEVEQEHEQEQPLSRVPTEDIAVVGSDGDNEDETEIHAARSLSRTNSYRSRELVEEEGRAHRAGHKFRRGVSESTDVVNADVVQVIDDIGSDPNHARVLSELAEDIGGELLEKVKEKGVIRAFKEHKELTARGIKESDLEYWPHFVEAQRKAKANMILPETRQQCEAREKLAES